MESNGLCLAEDMHVERSAARRAPRRLNSCAQGPQPCRGPATRSMYYGRHARVYARSAANSDYSDYYYELYTPYPPGLRQINRLHRSLFKIKIAYIVLTLFVVLSILAFILMNPTVSPFIDGGQEPFHPFCFKCKEVYKKCSKPSVIDDIRQGDPNQCCIKDFKQIITLIYQCKRDK